MVHLFRGRETTKPASTRARSATQVLPETQLANEPLPSGAPPEDALVVTISRQFGSGGSDIARLVADLAGLNYIDHHIISEVANRLGVEQGHAAQQDEQTSSMVGHILDAVKVSTPFTINYHSLIDPHASLEQAHETAYLHLTQKVVLELATQGNAIIVGRGSQFLLRHAPRTLHIYIFAPLTYRINVVMQQFQLNQQTAIRLIEQRDYEQESYLRRHYGADGYQPDLYHMLLNTGLFTFKQAADLIYQALPSVKITPPGS